LEKTIFSISTIGKILYVSHPDERVLATDFAQYIYIFSRITFGIFLYEAQSVERVLAIDFGSSLGCFESQYQNIPFVAVTVERVSSTDI